MRSTLPTGRTVAIGLLVLVGVGCLFPFSATVAGFSLTVKATVVNPATDAGTVANASSDVVNLDRRLDTPIIDGPVKSVAEAARTGSYNGTVEPPVRTELDGIDAQYAVYNGSYYRWNWTTRTNGDGVRLRMEPVNGTTVADDVATSYAEASPAAQRAIRTGSASTEKLPTGVIVRNGTYYALTPASFGQFVGIVLKSAVSYLLSLVGPGYLAVGLGLVAVRYRDPKPRPVTPRRAVAVAAVAVPVGIIVAATAVSGSLAFYLIYPGVGSVVAGGFVAGVFAYRAQWLLLVVFTALVVALGVAVSFLAGGVGGLLFGVIGLVVGVLAGVLPFVYGVVFAADTD
ncbi:MAG: hypothetical protein ABEI99_08325 [Halobaculum sp.]